MTIIYGGEPRKPGKLRIVWNRDKPRFEAEVKGFTVTRGSEIECLDVVIASLERCLIQQKKRRSAVEPAEEKP